MEQSYAVEFDWFLNTIKKSMISDQDQTIDVQSIFFGGGSPSLAPPTVIKSVIDKIKNSTNLLPDAEITLEANPTVRNLNS